VRVAVILLAVAGTAGHLAYLDALWWHSLGLTARVSRDVSSATILLLTAHAVVSFVCSALSVAMVLSERHRQEAARALALAFGAWSYLMAYAGATLLFRPPTPGMRREIFEAHFLAVEMIGLAGLVRFTSIFPRSLTDAELEPLPTLPPMLVPFHHASVGMRRRHAPLVAATLVLLVLWGWAISTGRPLSDAGLSRGMDLVRLCAAGLVVMNLRRAWAVATEGDRDGLTWLLVALAILLGALSMLIGGNMLVAVTGFPEPDVAWRPILLDLGLVGFLVAIAMSVLSRGRRDPARVLHRTASLAAAITVGLIMAAGLEALFGGDILSAFSLRHGVGSAVAFAVVLSTYRGIHAFVGRLLPI
jgi:hypothetical protein